jgi:hypothetical protein
MFDGARAQMEERPYNVERVQLEESPLGMGIYLTKQT